MLWYKLYNLYVLWPSSKNRAHVTDEKLGYNDMHKANPNITKSCVKWPFIYSPYIQLYLSRSVILRYKGHLCSKRRGFCGSLQNTPLQIFYFILWRIFFFEYRRCVFWRSKNFNQLLWHCSFFSFISWHFIKVIINYGIQLVYINNLLLLIKQKLTTGYLLKHMQVCDHFLFLHWNNLNWRIHFIKVISILKI